ncbi:MAG: hypothetical protein IPK93_07620 [Solirubrobacterales bacterium]|nr:hypothetical protein [Solirubrobacterales bacterium]
MADDKLKQNRDGSTIDSNQYVALILAIAVPIIGLLFGIYLKTGRNEFADRIIIVSLVSLVIWTCLILFI